MTESTISRRKLLKAGVLTVAGISLQGFSLPVKSLDTPIIKVGIIGSGNRGAGLASLLRYIPGVEVSAICDIVRENLQKALAYCPEGVKTYTNYRQLLDNKHINAVIIATPLYLHYQMAMDSLDAGKHIYLEKSLAYDIPQSLALLQKVRTSQLVFQVGFQYRYYTLYKKIKEIIDQKKLGKITHLESQYNRNSDWRNPVNDPKLERTINWRMYREYCGGPLSELCAHQIDMVNFLLDSHPLKVTAMGGINYWKDGRDTYDHIRAIYEYPEGIKSSFSSVLSNAYNGYNIKIYGNRATVEIQRESAFIYSESVDNILDVVDGVTGATVNITTQGKGLPIPFLKPDEIAVEPTTYALRGFLDCIINKKQPLSNAQNAKDTSIAIVLGNIAADTESYQVWKPEYSI